MKATYLVGDKCNCLVEDFMSCKWMMKLQQYSRIDWDSLTHDQQEGIKSMFCGALCNGLCRAEYIEQHRFQNVVMTENYDPNKDPAVKRLNKKLDGIN